MTCGQYGYSQENKDEVIEEIENKIWRMSTESDKRMKRLSYSEYINLELDWYFDEENNADCYEETINGYNVYYPKICDCLANADQINVTIEDVEFYIVGRDNVEEFLKSIA